jgi:citrate synthase
VTALGTLKGPLHGGANEAAMKQFIEIGSVDNVDDWFEHKMATKGRIMGLGHRVYKVEDPRSIILRKLAKEVTGRTGVARWFDIAAKLEERALEHPYFKERNIYPNVDYYSGPLLDALGIPIDLFTPMFAISRVAGWTAHMLEQQQNNRLIRPRAFYDGPTDQEWDNFHDRVPQVEAQPDISCVAGQPANCPVALRIPPTV